MFFSDLFALTKLKLPHFLLTCILRYNYSSLLCVASFFTLFLCLFCSVVVLTCAFALNHSRVIKCQPLRSDGVDLNPISVIY